MDPCIIRYSLIRHFSILFALTLLHIIALQTILASVLQWLNLKLDNIITHILRQLRSELVPHHIWFPAIIKDELATWNWPWIITDSRITLFLYVDFFIGGTTLDYDDIFVEEMFWLCVSEWDLKLLIFPLIIGSIAFS